MTSWLQVAGEATQIRMALVAACPHPQQGHMALILDFDVAFGDNADPGYGKTTDLDTQTWSLPASGSGCHHVSPGHETSGDLSVSVVLGH